MGGWREKVEDTDGRRGPLSCISHFCFQALQKFVVADVELAYGTRQVGERFAEEGVASEFENPFTGIDADETPQATAVVDDAALPELVEGLRGGVDVDLQLHAVVADSGDAFVRGIFSGKDFVHQTLCNLKIYGAGFTEYHRGK